MQEFHAINQFKLVGLRTFVILIRTSKKLKRNEMLYLVFRFI